MSVVLSTRRCVYCGGWLDSGFRRVCHKHADLPELDAEWWQRREMQEWWRSNFSPAEIRELAAGLSGGFRVFTQRRAA